jgi:cytoskeletal protein RodZ
MASVAHDPAVAPQKPLRKAQQVQKPARSRKRAAAKKKKKKAGLLGGIVWIVLLAGLLGGIVALNVAVLQLNVRLQQANDAKADVRARSVALAGQLSSAGSSPQVAAAAEGKLGLVPAAPDQTTYVDVAPRRKK